MYVIRTLDHDNAVARLKWACDFLVRVGYLLDDKPANCELVMPVQMPSGGTGTPPRLVFAITPID